MSESRARAALDELQWSAEAGEIGDGLLAIMGIPEPTFFSEGPLGDYPEGRTPAIAELALDDEYLYGAED